MGEQEEMEEVEEVEEEKQEEKKKEKGKEKEKQKEKGMEKQKAQKNHAKWELGHKQKQSKETAKQPKHKENAAYSAWCAELHRRRLLFEAAAAKAADEKYSMGLEIDWWSRREEEKRPQGEQEQKEIYQKAEAK